MITLKDFTSLPIRIFEEHIADKERAYIPFARTESFLKDINANPNYLVMHFWTMEKIVILGMLDKRVPYFDEGKHIVREYGYEPFVRNIGVLPWCLMRGY